MAVAAGAGSISAPVVYGAAFLATLVAGAGYVHWDERQHPHEH